MVNNLEFELFLHPEHQRNLDYIGPDVVEHYFGTLRPDAFSSLAGVFFPYGGLSIVEVPGNLRTYGGGWRLDSVVGLPGMVLLKEQGLPTARLASPWGDDTILRTLYLGDYLDRDYSGGNLVSAISRHSYSFRSSAVGDDSVALDVLIELLAAELFEQSCSCTFDRDRRVFSAHRFHERLVRRPTLAALLARVMGNTSEVRDEIERLDQYRASTWDTVERMPMSQVVNAVGPKKAIRALELKMRKIAELLADALGRDKLKDLLDDLAHKQGSFSGSDLEVGTTAFREQLELLVGDWIWGTRLPGFLVSPIAVARLPDDGRGRPRYQTSLNVRNDEPVTGHIALSWHARSSDEYGETGPFRLEGNTSAELGFVSSSPPEWVAVNPYLSLNRNPLRLEINAHEPIGRKQATPFTGARSSEWVPPPAEGIVVDDLDPGFGIVGEQTDDHGVDTLRRHRTYDMEFDGGVPIYPMCCGIGKGKWQRAYGPWAWGKYRRTYVRASRGSDEEMAVFVAELPHSGSWRLDYHLPGHYDWRNPGKALRHEDLGDLFIKLSSNGNSVAIAFDASGAEHGWNDLGVHKLAAGNVQVSVSSPEDETTAVADAIRLIPVRPRL